MDLLTDYDFHLPPELIAKEPCLDRSSSRLLAVVEPHRAPVHDRFLNIKHYLKPGDALILNNTKVMKARIFATKSTGGAVELLLIRPTAEDQWLVLLKGSGPFRPGAKLTLNHSDIELSVIKPSLEEPGAFLVSCSGNLNAYCDAMGELPIPAYLGRRAGHIDDSRYQTVFAKDSPWGAVAAPTAGLHFTHELLSDIKAMGVNIVECTLAVGPGTFFPIRTENIDEHQMHWEQFHLSEEAATTLNQVVAAGGRLIPVGTTSVRVLEHCASLGLPFKETHTATNIFIRPGFQFKACDALITNFHVPRSTLFLLIAAILGREHALKVYEAAIAEKYRFFSYGDACFFAIDRMNTHE
jgi:S-adenosylmethionine:tRNA ribosyltransferase-isomerase